MLITPILEKHSAYDATKATYFYIYVGKGGDDFDNIKLVVKDNDTGQQLTSGYWLRHYSSAVNGRIEIKYDPVPSIVKNGGYYSAYVQTQSFTEGLSAKSNSIQFHCIAEPTLTRDDYSEGEVVDNSYKNFTTTYTQASREPLNFVKHKITNLTTNEIIKEQTQYAGTTTVPYTISFNVGGLLNDNSYKYELYYETVNGLTGSMTTNFSAQYSKPTYDSLLKLKNLCDYGVIRIDGKFKSISGINWHGTYQLDGDDTYLHLPKSLNPIDYEGKSNEPRAYWNYSELEGTNLNQNNMTAMVWVGLETDYSYWGNIYLQFGMQEGSTRSKYAHQLRIRRVRIPNSNNYGDCVEYAVYDSVNGEYITKCRSNYITDLGVVGDKYYIYFNRVGTSVDLRLTKLTDNGNSVWNITTSPDTINNSELMYWNKFNNYSMTVQTAYNPEYEEQITSTPDEDILQYVSVNNGNFYHMSLYDGTVEYNETPPENFDDEQIIFNCNFNGNLNAGNFDIGADVDTILVKKRMIDSNVWIPIYKIQKTQQAFDFTLYDPMCANNVEYEYAIVPCKTSGSTYIEGNYIVKDINSTFDGFVVADKTNIYKGMVNVNYDATDSAEYGLLQPLNKKYPIVIHNGITRYNKGTLNCAIMGYLYPKTRRLNPMDVAKERNEMIDFLNNNEVKIVKSWTGDIIVIQKIGDVTRSINSQTGYSSIGFSWVEQGHINDVELYESEILQAIEGQPQFIVESGGEEEEENTNIQGGD